MQSVKHNASYFIKALAAAYLVREHVAELTICVGPSMIPTFDPQGEVALVEKMFLGTTVRGRKIQKGDIVIARSVLNARQSVCKRVLGLEGDVVCYDSPGGYARYNTYDPLDGFGDGTSTRGGQTCVRVPKGHVFLQGDNTLNSTDSRQYGPVPYSTLQGRVVYKLWPRLGSIHR
jgi:signal peptidase I